MKRRAISLLKWLDSKHSNVLLRFPQVGSEDSGSSGESFYVQPLNEQGQLTNLFRAHISLPNETILKSVFLIVQKDQYLIPSSHFGPLFNVGVDFLWDKAFKSLCIGSDKFVNFSIEDDEGEAPIYKSLFYCGAEGNFFHPPCPKCGQILEQCYDDELLQQKGLKAYSSSLKRYLYCGACKESDFYAEKLDSESPPFLKDAKSLFKGWSDLLKSGQPPSCLPCHNCDDRDTCHDGAKSYLSCLKVFSFYDFHMLVIEAADLSILDFTALISGASIDELASLPEISRNSNRTELLINFAKKHGNRADRFFSSQEKVILEVLYLKLSLLRQLYKNLIFAENGKNVSLLLRRPEQFWVKLHGGDSRLPWQWNFEVLPMDLNCWPMNQDTLPAEQQVPDFDYWARIWFGLLTVNSSQSFNDVSIGLDKFKEESVNILHSFSSQEMRAPFLNLDNVFWNPEKISPSETCQHIWEKVLALGSVLISKYDAWNPERFLTEIDQLLLQIKSTMFEGVASITETTYYKEDEDSEIAEILANIISRWQQKKPDFKNLGELDASEALDRTVILEGGEKILAETLDSRSDSKDFQSNDFPDSTELDKTVMLNPEQVLADLQKEKAESVESKISPDVENDFDADKTVLLTAEELAKKLKEKK